MSTGLREVERGSIRAFVQRCADQGLLSGRVLDYGCGRSPYEDVVRKAGGDYWGWDNPRNSGYVENLGSVYHMGDDPPYGPWDAVLCTQVIQYAWWTGWGYGGDTGFLHDLKEIARGGVLVMTGPTNWPVIEGDDKVRFTANGIARELGYAGFKEVSVEERASVSFEGERWCLGWQAVATA